MRLLIVASFAFLSVLSFAANSVEYSWGYCPSDSSFCERMQLKKPVAIVAAEREGLNTFGIFCNANDFVHIPFLSLEKKYELPADLVIWAKTYGAGEETIESSELNLISEADGVALLFREPFPESFVEALKRGNRVRIEGYSKATDKTVFLEEFSLKGSKKAIEQLEESCQ